MFENITDSETNVYDREKLQSLFTGIELGIIAILHGTKKELIVFAGFE